MLSDLLTVVGQVATLFLMMGVGYVLTKIDWLSEETVSQCTKFLLYVVCSCIVITRFQIEANAQIIRTMLMAIFGLLLPFVVMLPVIHLMFRKEAPDSKVVRRFGMVFPNGTLMGLPLLAGVLGDEAVIYGVLCLLVFSIIQWTYGIATYGGTVSVRRMVINPGIISMGIGLVLFATGLRLPAPVYNAMDFLGSTNTPLGMVIIGSQMARADILSALKAPKLYITAAVKLIVVPAVAVVGLLPFRMEPLTYCACVVLAACPTGGTTSMLAQMFKRDIPTAAQMVTLSTLLSIITLPIFAVIARQISGLA